MGFNMKLNELLETLSQIQEMDVDNALEELVKKALAKVGIDLREVTELSKENLLKFADIMYEYGFEDGANSLDESLNEAAERYLSVEPNEENPQKERLALYQNGTVVDTMEIDLTNPLKTSDQEIRELAKKEFSNITNDIRVAWF